MEIRHWWRYHYTVNIFTILIVIALQSLASHGHSANNNNNQHYHSLPQQQQHTSSNNNLDSLSIRRDIASISVTEVNRSRNLRQAYDNSLSYSEIVPANPTHHNHHLHGEYDNNIERNSSDNRKPAFYGCKDYAPKVKEEQQWNTNVITVDAEDPDEFDKITYSIYTPVNERSKFRINSKTGEITTAYTFDRDEPIREKEVRHQHNNHFSSSSITIVVDFAFFY